MASSISKFSQSLIIVKSRLLVVIFFLAIGDLQADLDSNSTPRLKRKSSATGSIQPTAVADVASAEVSRAREVTIRLRGIARGGGQIEFKLQQKPRHGRILSSKPIGLDSLDVVYRNSGDQSSDIDSFIFAVRSGGSGPFSPGEVKIRVIDQPGRLLAPESLAFPATLAGKSATESFVVLNEGGETLNGKITVTPPWQLKETAAYFLSPGEKRKFTILFSPTGNGPVDGRLVFEGTKPTNVELRGEGIGTFLVNPAKVKLVPSPDGRRQSIVSLQNNTDEPITIEIQSTFDLPKNVTLQFGETKEIPVVDDGIGQLNSGIIFRSGIYSSRVEIIADESPARAGNITAPTPSPAVALVESSPAPTPAPIPPAISLTVPEEVVATTPEPTTPAEYIASKVVRLSRDSIRIDWTAQPNTNYSIQQRYLFLDKDKKLQTQWMEVPSAKIQTQGSRGQAIIGDLDARTVFTFRVIQISGEKDARLASLPLVYQTEPNLLQRLTWQSLLYPLGAILLGLVIRNRWLQRTA